MSQSAPVALTLDRLRRLQATLWRRVRGRDPDNIHAVGFTQAEREPGSELPVVGLPIAQFAVHRKLRRVMAARRIEPQETVRLLDRQRDEYDQFEVQTDVLEVQPPLASGVHVLAGLNRATTSLVVRWTTAQPVPPPPTGADRVDLSWRWGVVTVSHLFSNAVDGSVATKLPPVQVERRGVCVGGGPAEIGGRVVARGRVPGGPDISLIETGLDRLWLSGFLTSPADPSLPSATPSQLVQWVTSGVDGRVYGDGFSAAWQWRTFYPTLSIPQLGRLQHVIRFELAEPDGSESELRLAPGSSGSVLVAAGTPLGMHIASEQPRYRVGYAQSFTASLPWLQSALRASELVIVAAR